MTQRALPSWRSLRRAAGRSRAAAGVVHGDKDGEVVGPHGPAVVSPEVGLLRKQLHGQLRQAEAKSRREAMVAIEEPVARVESEPQRDLDTVGADALSECIEVRRGVVKGGADLFSIHGPIANNEIRGESHDHRPQVASRGYPGRAAHGADGRSLRPCPPHGRRRWRPIDDAALSR